MNKVDVQQIESLNYAFHRVIGQVFLGTGAEDDASEQIPNCLHEMTGAQKRSLFYLELHGPQRMTDLARGVGVTLPAATAVIDRLVRAGLVAREQDPVDRRVTRALLTQQGNEALTMLNRIHESRLARALERLDPEKRTELVACFVRINALLSELQSPVPVAATTP